MMSLLRTNKAVIRSATRLRFVRFNSVSTGHHAPPVEDDFEKRDFPKELPDYPEVEREYYFSRDPDANWDDKQNRRNFGEFLHLDDDALNLWSPHYYDAVKDSTALRWQFYFFSAIGAFSGICYYFFYPELKAVPRNYPDGLARDLGARSEEDAHLYKVYVDKTFYDKK